MAQARVVIAVIGPLLDGLANEGRERLERAGATVVPARAPGEDDIIASCAHADIVMVLCRERRRPCPRAGVRPRLTDHPLGCPERRQAAVRPRYAARVRRGACASGGSPGA